MRHETSIGSSSGEVDQDGPKRSSWRPGEQVSAVLVASIGLVVLAAVVHLVVLSRSSDESDPQRLPEAVEERCLDLAALAWDAPSMLGPTLLSPSELAAWWDATGRDEPERLAVSVEDLAELYAMEAEAEGIRGDLAFAQAVHETGFFTNSDTLINNFAGIGHYDHAESGLAYEDPLAGVRAQIQLLKRFALGNDALLAHEEVAPRALASAPTWDRLAGTWATDPEYWSKLSALYRQMLDHAGYSYLGLFYTADSC